MYLQNLNLQLCKINMLKHCIVSTIKYVINERSFSIKQGTLLTSQVYVAELANGIRVASQASDSWLSCTSLFVRTGSRFENEFNNGISHFIEHMAYQGFNSLSKCNLQECVNSKGIKLTVHSTREYQVFTALSTADNGPECLNILMKILVDLELSDDEIQLQKEYVNSEALDDDNNPKAVVFDYLNQTAFQGTSLGQSVIGPNKNRMKYERKMLCNFIESNYQPHRLLFVSTGCVSHLTNLCDINRCLGHMSARVPECADIGPSRFTGSAIVYRDDSMPYAHVAIAVEVPGYSSSEYLPLLVASCLTGSWDRTQGGTDRHASPLARAAAISMLCEKFESFYMAYQDTGLWGIYFVGDKINLDDMISNVQDQWMKMCTTLSDGDVQRAINLARLKLANNRAGVIRSNNEIGLQLLYNSRWKSLAEIFNDMENLSKKVIKNLGYNFIYDKCPVLAAVGPTECLPDYTRLRAGMYWLRM